MIEMKTSELIGRALDWAVAMSEGATNLYFDTVSCWWFTLNGRDRVLSSGWSEKQNYCPSTDWRYGGPLIEQHGINVMMRYGSLPPNHVQDVWDAVIKPEFYESGRPTSGVKKEVTATGPFPLIAAMRCLVASKLGDTVQVPKGLLP